MRVLCVIRVCASECVFGPGHGHDEGGHEPVHKEGGDEGVIVLLHGRVREEQGPLVDQDRAVDKEEGAHALDLWV